MASEQNASEQQHEYGASDITVLEGLEAVRKRPGMYIGSTTERGLHHLVYEVVDNSVDEALAGYASKIDVTIQADGSVRVRMMAAVFPWMNTPPSTKSTVEVVMTVLHAGGKFGGGGYSVSGGLHGVGISVVNALSTRVITEVHRQGYAWHIPSLTVVCRMVPCARVNRPIRPVLFRPSTRTQRFSRPSSSTLRTLRPFPADGVPEQGPDHYPDR